MSIGKKLLMLALAAPFVVAEAPTVQAAPARKPPLCTCGALRGLRGATARAGRRGGRPGEQEPRHRDALPAAAREAEAPEEGNVGPGRLPQGRLQRRQREGQDHGAHHRRLLPVTGKLRTEGRPRRSSPPATSVCGDGVIDPAGGEAVRRRRSAVRPARSATTSCQCLPTRADKSGPIEITADGRKLVAVNTDTDSVSFFAVGADGLLTKLHEVAVGDEPRSVATLLNKPLGVRRQHGERHGVGASTSENYTTVATIDVGTEPWAVVASPNGTLRLRRQRQRQCRAGDRHGQQHRHRDHPGRPQPARARHHQRRRRGRSGRDPVRAELLRPAAHRLRAAEQRQPGRHRRSRRGLPAGLQGAAGGRRGHLRRFARGGRRRRVDRDQHASSTTSCSRRWPTPASTSPAAPFVNTTAERRPAHHLRRRRHRRHAGAADGRVPEPAAEHRALRRPRLRAQLRGLARAAAALQPQRAEPHVGVRRRHQQRRSPTRRST